MCEGQRGEAMSFEDIKEKIEGWLQPVLEEKNLFLVEIKVSLGKKIEVYLDSDTGIHIDDCAYISRFLEKHLDEGGLVPANYILEVSSPGMSNPLRVPRQYKRRIGRILEILKTDGTNVEAQLLAADDERIKLKEVKEEPKKKKKSDQLAVNSEEAKEYELKYDEIKRAILQFKF
jgi:ribosome maturation factor RimP